MSWITSTQPISAPPEPTFARPAPPPTPRPRIIPATKVCRSCGHELTAAEFHPQPKSRDGLQSFCKVCQSLRWRIRSTKNADKRAMLQRQFDERRGFGQ